MQSVSHSSFDAATFSIAIDVETVNAVKTLAKDGSEDEAADETVWGNGLLQERRTEEVEYSWIAC